MDRYLQIDAYKILEVPISANDEQIRFAYHQKVQSGNVTEIERSAYESIKDRNARESYLWNSVYSFLEKPPEFAAELPDIESVIQEVAFLSDWELGVSYES